VCFVDRCLSFCTFSFDHCRFTDSGYPFGIFKIVSEAKYLMVTVSGHIFDIYFTEYGTALTTILPILFLYLNTDIVTGGTFEP
jgi:hypothetical protein